MARQVYYRDCPTYVTRDGSVIRELMHPTQHGNRQQSLAEATVAPGAVTALHRHHQSEELYHIIEGTGRMMLADDEFDVAVGDTICIPPMTPHKIANTGTTSLRFLCCCAPAYAHDDTEILEV